MKCKLIVLMCFTLPIQSFAWGLTGHRIVGEIASKYLTPKANAAIADILGTESLAMACNWADFIKSDNTTAIFLPGTISMYLII